MNTWSDFPLRCAQNRVPRGGSKSDPAATLAQRSDGTGWWTWKLVCGFATVLIAVSSVAAEKPAKDHMQLSSPAFTEGAPIPAKYTCDQKDLSPPLKWTGVPAGAKSLALIADDPDAPVGTWVHWVLYDL